MKIEKIENKELNLNDEIFKMIEKVERKNKKYISHADIRENGERKDFFIKKGTTVYIVNIEVNESTAGATYEVVEWNYGILEHIKRWKI